MISPQEELEEFQIKQLIYSIKRISSASANMSHCRYSKAQKICESTFVIRRVSRSEYHLPQLFWKDEWVSTVFHLKSNCQKLINSLTCWCRKMGGRVEKVFETILLLPPTTLMVYFFHKLLSRKSLVKKKSTLFMVRMIHF